MRSKNSSTGCLSRHWYFLLTLKLAIALIIFFFCYFYLVFRNFPIGDVQCNIKEKSNFLIYLPRKFEIIQYVVNR